LKVIKYGGGGFSIPPQFKLTAVKSTNEEAGIISYTSGV